MDVYTDALALVHYALYVFTGYGQELALTIVVGLGLGVGCWVLASHYSRLWNLRFRTTTGHHSLCCVASLCTLLFVLLFASLKYTKQAADLFIAHWQEHLLADATWSTDTYRTAYHAVKNLGLEDFRQVPLPEQGGRIPVHHPQSIKKVAEVYATAAVQHFQHHRPFLSKILWAQSAGPAARIEQRSTDFFRQHPGSTYSAAEVVRIAATEIKAALHPQTERVVPIARTTLLLLFGLVQLIPFSIIGYAAYRDLKVST